MINAAQYREIVSVETEIELSSTDAATSAAQQATLRAAQLHSSGRYTARLRGRDGGAYEVHVLLFQDEAAAQAYWSNSHRASALAQTQPLEAGDAAWMQAIGEERGAPFTRAALRSGRAVYEIRARGAQARVPAFVQHLGLHARDVLGR